MCACVCVCVGRTFPVSIPDCVTHPFLFTQVPSHREVLVELGTHCIDKGLAKREWIMDDFCFATEREMGGRVVRMLNEEE